MTLSEPASVLVYVGLDRVGDALLKLPFVRGLREAFPAARIAWVAGKETSVYAGVMAPLVRGLLDEVIENAHIGETPAELLHRPLDGRRFDLVIDTQRILWVTLSLWRVPHRTFLSPAARFLFSSRKPPKGYRSPPSMQRQLLDLLELASGRAFPTPETLDVAIDPALAADAARLLPEGPAYVGFAPGAGGPPKCWPLQNFVALAKGEAARGRVPVFLLGPKETGWRSEIAAAVPEALFPLQADAIESAHGYAPTFTIALARRLAAAVSNDSGAGHMLAVGGSPLVVLYGSTVPEKFRPMTRRLTIVRAGDFGGKEMRLIPLAPVADALDRALKS
ncbi:MAG: lipopolysaccharide heptosyltransferase family protein [Rhodospirillales bacterium]|nr:lipopolysaccharide heptosyltransferase family protein [Rhodospirillales bacterium]